MLDIYIDIIYIGGLRDRLTNYSKRLDLRMRVMIVCVVLVVAENGCLLLLSRCCTWFVWLVSYATAAGTLTFGCVAC